MHGSMMMPDSIFTQIFELFPDNLPAVNNENAFAAYQFDMLYPDGAQGMGPMGGCGGMMQFNNNIDFQLHFTDMQLISKNIDKNTIKVKYYDNTSNSWMEMSGTNINTASNTITFSNNNINNLIILTGEKIATGVSENQTVVKDFQLYQNYPNPFNPSTNIKFELKENSHVTLSVYNIIGQKVAELINSDLSAGIHTAMFNAANLSSGVYFYELKAGSHSSVKKMELLK
ncbi:MAG: T9SS type A sorting domain-containing protein [Ignavibacteriaceae bacterium]